MDEKRCIGDGIAIDRSGTGPAVLLTHGLGDSAQTWSELRGYLDGFETWSWDLLGHGASEKPAGADAYSMQRALDDLEGMIDRVGRDVVLIGHSLGGYLSQHRAVRELSRIRALVLIATGPGYRDASNRERWNGFVREAASRFDIPPSAAAMAFQHDEIVMNRLESISVPVLQVLGARDRQYHGAFEVVKKRVAGVESLMVPGAGHHVHRSHAAEVGPAVRRFLETLP